MAPSMQPLRTEIGCRRSFFQEVADADVLENMQCWTPRPHFSRSCCAVWLVMCM